MWKTQIHQEENQKMHYWKQRKHARQPTEEDGKYER